MSDKYDKKLEKKRRKVEYKLEKKRLEVSKDEKHETVDKGGGAPASDSGLRTPDSDKTTIQVVLPKEEPKPWYKNPSWIRAIAAVVTMIILIISKTMTVFRLHV